jgi:predicted dehydrogenase
VGGTALIGEATGVDHYAVASLRFPGGVVASLACGVQVDLGSALRIFGSAGTMVLRSPWLPGLGGGATRIRVEPRGAAPQEHVLQPATDLYAIEADAVAASLREGLPAAPMMTWDDTLGNMTTLDRWRDAVGLVYEMELRGTAGGALTGGRNGEPRGVQRAREV